MAGSDYLLPCYPIPFHPNSSWSASHFSFPPVPKATFALICTGPDLPALLSYWRRLRGPSEDPREWGAPRGHRVAKSLEREAAVGSKAMSLKEQVKNYLLQTFYNSVILQNIPVFTLAI